MEKVIVIVGPTAIGKTKISIELAKRLGLEIISGDSVAVYKRLDIGSAKPTVEEMQGVKHHLIDVLDPREQYDVSMFQAEARKIIKKNKKVIICGGTGLYIQSVLFDYKFIHWTAFYDFYLFCSFNSCFISSSFHYPNKWQAFSKVVNVTLISCYFSFE